MEQDNLGFVAVRLSELSSAVQLAKEDMEAEQAVVLEVGHSFGEPSKVDEAKRS